MEPISMLQSFALAKNGEIVSVMDVERGLACHCICPACKDTLVAKQGDVRIWHFAHASHTDCLIGAESALHLAAKQLIEKWQGIMMPEIKARRLVQLADGRNATGDAYLEAEWVNFEQVSLEESIGSIRPDLIAQAGNARYLIEIAVTHFVDDEKRAAIKKLGLPALEISLDMMGRDILDWTTLEDTVIHGTTAKSWLFHPDQQYLEELAFGRATTAANEKPLLVMPNSPNAAPFRTRFWIKGRIVDLIDLPFSVAIWTPYDPEINEIIKSLARTYRGKWNWKYKNSLFPPSVKPQLLQALRDMA